MWDSKKLENTEGLEAEGSLSSEDAIDESSCGEFKVSHQAEKEN